MSNPRKSKGLGAKYRDAVWNAIITGNFINAVGRLEPIPEREKVREKLSEYFNIRNRDFRVIKVEEIGDYKVFIQIPGEKSEYDFFVWRALFDKGNLTDLKIPTHDDLGRMYLNLKEKHSRLDEYLINATIRYIRDRYPIDKVLSQYFSNLPSGLLEDVKKFLLTLKWIAIQEDANYPPPDLGSLYALSVYAVLEVTRDLSSVRRVIRF